MRLRRSLMVPEALKVTGLNPADDATGVAVDASLVLRFNKPISPGAP